MKGGRRTIAGGTIGAAGWRGDDSRDNTLRGRRTREYSRIIFPPVHDGAEQVIIRYVCISIGARLWSRKYPNANATSKAELLLFHIIEEHNVRRRV